MVLVARGGGDRVVTAHVRRWRHRYASQGYAGLLDKRLFRPSGRAVPPGEVERVLRLYRERYAGFNVRHFHQIARREHEVHQSYSWVKQVLQAAGLVKKHRARGRHRRRREPRACWGELLHIDGSTHPWFALAPETRATLIAVPDDATSQLLYAQFWERETTQAVMTALREVITTYGLPMALYSDRAGWAFYTPTAKGPVDKTRLTQVGRALKQLGVEHIPAYSPQARGRSERLDRTLQDRLVNELRVAGISEIDAANAYLREIFLPQHNATFSSPASGSGLGVGGAGGRRRGSDSLSPGNAHRRSRQHRDTRPRRAADRETTWSTHLCRTRGRRASSSRRPAFNLAGPPTLEPLRCGGPARGRCRACARPQKPGAHKSLGPAGEDTPTGPQRPQASL